MTRLIIFDGDCGFCTSSVRIVHRWVSSSVDAVPYQRADLGALGRSVAECSEAVQYRDLMGRWHSAGRAVAALLTESGLPWSLLGRIARLPGLAWLVDRFYELVSANRDKLPGGTPACQSPAAVD